MKTLTLITLSIMVPTFVVSAFSMNVHMPFPEGGFAWWAIMAGAALSSIGFLAWGRYKGW